MASTYTTSLQIQKIGNGEQSGIWGSTTNTNWDLIEQAVAGVQSITMLNADYTLSVLNGASDEARNMVLVVGGTNSAIRKIVAPLVNKLYVVTNNTSGGYAITIGGATGSTVTIPNGTTVQVYCNATNFYSAQTSSAGNFNVNGDLTVIGTSTFTGAATAPTASAGTNTTQVATTAFVTTAVASAVPTGVITMWSGSIASVPSGWYLCDGTNGTPDLRSKFIVGAGSTYAVNATGGSADAITVAHTHTATSTSTSTPNDPGHSHTLLGSTSTAGSGGTFRLGAFNDGNLTSVSASTGITVATSTSTTVNSAGSSGTNANLPPYLALAYIMKG